MKNLHGKIVGDIEFTVEVNPFLHKAVINAKIGSILYTKIMYYEMIDEWGSFEFGETTFDIHFHYEVSFSVSIYACKENVPNYKQQCSVKLNIVLIDNSPHK